MQGGVRTILWGLLIAGIRAEVAYESRQFQAFDCANPAQVAKVGIQAPPCKEDPVASTQKNATFVLLQRARYKRLDGYRCSIVVSALSTYCGHYDHQTVIPQWSKIGVARDVSTAECQQYFKDKEYVDPRGKRHRLQVGGTSVIAYEHIGETRIWESSDVQCYGASYRGKPDVMLWEQLKITLAPEELWVEPATNKVIVRNGNLWTTCTPEDLECDTKIGRIWWRTMAPGQHCTLHVTRRTSGIIVGDGHGRRVYMSNDGTMIRLVLKEHENECGETVIATEFERLFLTEPQRAQPFHPDLPADEVSITTYVDAQDSYLYGYLSNYVRESFAAMTRRNCRKEGKTRDRALGAMASAQQVRKDGAIAADGQGFFFQAAGDYFYHYRCRPIVATARDEPRCYNALPVDLLQPDAERYFTGLGLPMPNPTDETGRKLPILYIEPVTHRLTSEGIERPCSTAFPAGYKNNIGMWIQVLAGTLHVTTAPVTLPERDGDILDDVGEPKPVDFEVGGIYTKKARNAYERDLQEDGRRAENIKDLIGGQTEVHHQGPLVGSDMFPDLPKVDLQRLMGPFLEVIDHAGRVIVVVVLLFLVIKGIAFVIGFAARCWTAQSIFGCTPHLCLACIPSALDCFLVRAGLKASRPGGSTAGNGGPDRADDEAIEVVVTPPAGGQGPEPTGRDDDRDAVSDIDFSTSGDEAIAQVAATEAVGAMGQARGQQREAPISRASSYRRLQDVVRREAVRLRKLKARGRKKRDADNGEEESLIPK